MEQELNQMLSEIEEGINTGSLGAEEAQLLLDDVQRALDIEGESMDMAVKGQILTALSVVSNLL